MAPISAPSLRAARRSASFQRPNCPRRRSRRCSPGALTGRLLFVPVAVLGDTGGVDAGSPDLKEREAAQIRVVLADDSVLLREGIASLLEKAGFEIVGQSGTAQDLLLKVRSYKPDIAM